MAELSGEATPHILSEDATEILFNPAYRGTPERAGIVADLTELLGEDEQDEETGKEQEGE